MLMVRREAEPPTSPYRRARSRSAGGRRGARAQSAGWQAPPHPGLDGRSGCHGSGVAAGARANLEAAGGPAAGGALEPYSRARSSARHPGSAAAMSLGTGDPTSEMVSAGGRRAGGWVSSLLAGPGEGGEGARCPRLPVTAAIIVTASERTSFGLRSL